MGTKQHIGGFMQVMQDASENKCTGNNAQVSRMAIAKAEGIAIEKRHLSMRVRDT